MQYKKSGVKRETRFFYTKALTGKFFYLILRLRLFYKIVQHTFKLEKYEVVCWVCVHMWMWVSVRACAHVGNVCVCLVSIAERRVQLTPSHRPLCSPSPGSSHYPRGCFPRLALPT